MKKWQSHTLLHPDAFDGEMLGVVSYREDCGLHLIVRITSYAEYIATRDPGFAASHPQLRRANPLGVTILLKTADQMVIASRRSLTAEQNPGLLYFIGGYAHPRDVLDASSDFSLQTIIRESAEELAVNVSSALVLGIATDPQYCHPELFAVASVSESTHEVNKKWQSAVDRSEAAELVFLPLQELLLSACNFYDITWSFETGLHLLGMCRRKL